MSMTSETKMVSGTRVGATCFLNQRNRGTRTAESESKSKQATSLRHHTMPKDLRPDGPHLPSRSRSM